MADELDTGLKSSRDRITELLTKQRPETEDITKAFLRAATGEKSYGEELNSLRARRLGDMKDLFDVFATHKGIKQADRKIGLAEKQFDFDQMKFNTEQENEQMKRFSDRLKYWATDLPRQQAVQLYEYVRDSKEFPEADRNPDVAIVAGMRDLGLMPVTDLNSKLPTGYRWTDDTYSRIEPIPGYTGEIDSGRVTPAQRANNDEIAIARRKWRQMLKEKFGGDPQAMFGAVFQTNPITKGLEPKDKALADLWTKAKERKVGDDPTYEDFINTFAPDYEPPPPPSPPPPEEPGMLERGWNSMFGPDIPPDLKARADRGEAFTEKELRELYESDPETFNALRQYLMQQER